MNCHEIQKMILKTPEHLLPALVKEHLKTCSFCNDVARLLYFPNNPKQIELFPTIDMSTEILRKTQHYRKKIQLYRYLSLAASILLGLLLGFLAEYFIVHNRPAGYELDYQFTDLLLVEYYQNQITHE